MTAPGRQPPISLDGTWQFFPGDYALEELDPAEAETIRVPGLWEAQGHLDLDGVAWYRRSFGVDDPSGYWSLRFGAVMDVADVWLNGVHVGGHEGAFTPFEVDVTRALAAGENVLAVRVYDPPLGDPEHERMAHGKQGWGSRHFPSRPSLYLTYGGIWQSVELHRHGPVVARDVFVSSDPDDLAVTVELRNRSAHVQRARLRAETLGITRELEAELEAGEARELAFELGPTNAPRWRRETPVLHELGLEVDVDGERSDVQLVRYGLRTVRVEGASILVDGEPYRMKSVLVQGFGADELYSDPDRDAIRNEVLAAKAMGFNMVRLHIKAFDPTYLDVCDELGMLVQCDVPVAEPIAYEELGDDTTLARRCVAAAQEQVRRDRNHPSVVLWAAMNEIGDKNGDIRVTRGYELFARTLYAAVREADPTRPVIENDWIEFDPGRVFCSPILTAHWYGRLHRDYFDKLERKAARWRGTERPLLVTEYGDWGLPEMPELPEPPFWDTREAYAAGLARTLWPGTIESFVTETQRYQGLSDRLQTEVFRRHDHLRGYCLTELTDVPHELNGLLDLHRRPKAPAVAEMTRANQDVLPILELHSLVAAAGEQVRAPLHVANDGPALRDVHIVATLGDATVEAGAAELPGDRASHLRELVLRAPAEPGAHELVVRVHAEGRCVSENVYPLHVVARCEEAPSVRLLGGGATAAALAAIGSDASDDGPLVVAERALDEEIAAELRGRLDAGETALVLAQPWDVWPLYPGRTRLKPVETRWGSSVYHFTTDDAHLPSFPRARLLVAEDSTIQARSVVVAIDDKPFPEQPAVIAYKPEPRAITGTVVGSHPVGTGRIVFCQYRLAERAAAGDAAAQALLGDLVRWAASARAAAEDPARVRERVA